MPLLDDLLGQVQQPGQQPQMPLPQSQQMPGQEEPLPSPGVSPRRAALRDVFSDVMFTLAQTLAAGASAPGQRGQMAGYAAALAAPGQRRTMIAQQEEERQKAAAVQAKLQQDLENSKLQAEKTRADMAQMGIREITREDGSKVLVKTDPITYQMTEIGPTAPAPEKDDYTLGPGQSRLSGDGALLASVGVKEPAERALTGAPAEYEYAKSQGYTGTFAEYQNEDANRRRAVAGTQAGKTASGLTVNQEALQIDRLSKRWQTATTTQRETSRQVGIMEQGLDAARKGDMAAGSQAVLVTFQKILDPNSVVRESEYARSSAGQSVLARIEGAYDRLAKGGAGVPLSELEKFADLARQMAKGSGASVSAIRSSIAGQAKRYQLPEDLIFGEDADGGNTDNAPDAFTLPDGNTVKRQPDGTYR